jgi:large subunit ribosomal protein L16
MALMPKRIKYRKWQKGGVPTFGSRGTTLQFGEYGLQSLTGAWVKATQLEAVRVALTRSLKRKGKIWVRVFPQKPISRHPAESRMGKGKGTPEFYVAVVAPGQILFEMEGVPLAVAQESMRLGAFKLPIPCRFVARGKV